MDLAQATEPPQRRSAPAITAPSLTARLVLVGALALSVFLLYRALARYDFDELVQSIRSVPARHLLAALGWAGASYFCLTFNDWLALRHVGRPLSYRTAATTSFVALSFGHNIGFAALSSGAVRYRFYSRAGLSMGEIAEIIVFCGLTIFLGMFVLGDLALVVRPDLASRLTGLPESTVQLLAVALALVPLAYVGTAVVLRRPIRFWRWSVRFPTLPIALAQIAIGTLNFLLVAACLHAIVSAVAEAGYFEVLASYVLANTAAIITHSPGGLGVIETVVLTVLQTPELIGPILLFRFVYFLIPLALGALVFAGTEIWGSPDTSRAHANPLTAQSSTSVAVRTGTRAGSVRADRGDAFRAATRSDRRA